MHELKRLKENLCKELEQYASRTQLDSNSLNEVDTLAHAIKNINRILEAKEEEEGGSYRMSRDGYSRGTIRDGMGQYEYNPQYTRINESNADGSYRRSMDGGSYRGSYYDGYSGNGMADELRQIMNNVHDERTRQDLQRFLSKMENM